MCSKSIEVDRSQFFSLVENSHNLRDSNGPLLFLHSRMLSDFGSSDHPRLLSWDFMFMNGQIWIDKPVNLRKRHPFFSWNKDFIAFFFKCSIFHLRFWRNLFERNNCLSSRSNLFNFKLILMFLEGLFLEGMQQSIGHLKLQDVGNLRRSSGVLTQNVPAQKITCFWNLKKKTVSFSL